MSIALSQSYELYNTFTGYKGFGTAFMDGVTIPNTSQIVTLNDFGGATRRLVKWSISGTITPLASSTSLSSNLSNLTLVNNSSGILWSSDGATSSRVVELSSLYTTTTTSNTAATVNSGCQRSCSVISDSSAYLILSTGNMRKFKNNAITGLSIGGDCLITATATSIMTGNQAIVSEYDLSGNLQKSFQLPNTVFSAITTDQVASLAYDDGLVTALCDNGLIYRINWIGAPELLNVEFSSSRMSGLCQSASGFSVLVNNNSSDAVSFGTLRSPALLGLSTTTNYNLFQIDTSRFNSDLIDHLYHNLPVGSSGDTIEAFTGAGFADNKFWLLTYGGESGGIDRFYLNTYTVSPESLTNKTHSAQESGIFKKNRKIVLVDDGTGQSYVDSDITMPATAMVYPVPSGKRIIEITLYETGIERKGEVSIYNT